MKKLHFVKILNNFLINGYQTLYGNFYWLRLYLEPWVLLKKKFFLAIFDTGILLNIIKVKNSRASEI